ncbi:MAG: PHP domain-containing protein, partial [Halobacteriales archaeon]|nr:PHP domain-containing protein [Halobacteriales archaeon]
MDNEDVAALLEEYASLRQRAGDQPYRVGAYKKAATAVALWPDPVMALVKKGWDPQAMPGIGPSLAGVLREIAERGTWRGLEESRKRYVLDVGEMATAKARKPRKSTGSIQLRGDLHSHTDATDGRDSILAMAQAAEALGYEYLAITDHSKETRVAGGLDDARMKLHLDRIRRVAEKVDIELLAGAEVDIKKDGSLDYPDKLLRAMDVVVCSVHFRHRLSGLEQTKRILTGMSNRYADILGHPSGRRSGIRPGMEIDLERIVAAAKEQGWCI